MNDYPVKHHHDCCEYDCWTRIKHFCICGRTGVNVGGVQGPRVVFCEEDLRRIYEKARYPGSFLVFTELVAAEASRAAEESMPAVIAAQAALSSLPSEQSLLSIRFCIRIGPIRICVEWLL